MSKLISPDRVRQLMAAMQPSKVVAPVVRITNATKIANAYEMIRKTGCTLTAASNSLKVSIKNIIKHAEEHNLPFLWKDRGLEAAAKKIVVEERFRNIRFGLKARVAYELAFKEGVSKACKMVGTSREGVYAYCRRHKLETPLRAGTANE